MSLLRPAMLGNELSQLVDQPQGVRPPALLRQTRVADLAHRTDPRLVATALGMTEEGAMHYLTDAVDHEDIAFSTEQAT